jgi:hypothetical protein
MSTIGYMDIEGDLKFWCQKIWFSSYNLIVIFYDDQLFEV